jgi:hypothetical protein
MALESYNCVLCQQSIEETNTHLFLNCQFAKICWSLIGITIQSGSDILEAVMQIRDQTHPNFFLMAAVMMCWSIWTVRNDLIFNGIQPRVESVQEIFRKEMKILSLRVKARFTNTFDLWIQNLL